MLLHILTKSPCKKTSLFVPSQIDCCFCYPCSSIPYSSRWLKTSLLRLFSYFRLCRCQLSFLFRFLQRPHVCIHAFSLQKILMCPLLNDQSTIHHLHHVQKHFEITVHNYQIITKVYRPQPLPGSYHNAL